MWCALSKEMPYLLIQLFASFHGQGWRKYKVSELNGKSMQKIISKSTHKPYYIPIEIY